MPDPNPFHRVRHRHPLVRTSVLVAALALPSLLAAGCGPSDGELASPPLLVSYGTGDMQDTIDRQLGLGEPVTAQVTGGLGFDGEAEMACGPTADDLAFRLRFAPADDGLTSLTLRVARAGHGEGGDHGLEHGGDHGNDQGGDHGEQHGTEQHGTEQHGDAEELAGDAPMPSATAPSVEELSHQEQPQAGPVEASAVLARIRDGRLVESTGTAQLTLRPATHAAGRHAVAGSFRVELAGEAGSGTLEGNFDDCYHFSG